MASARNNGGMNMAKENEIVLFETEDREITLNVEVNQDTVWLNRNQMAELFGRDVKTIGKHINNALKEELDNSTVANFATVQNEGGRDVERNIEYYNLDMIISVGYRVKSQRGIEFRRWANKVLKDYIIKGYAVNDKRLEALQKTVEIQAKMLATAIESDSDEVLKAVNLYTQALTLLDQYDHQSLEKPEGNQPIYRITYADCRAMVDRMEDSFKSDVFGVEKEPGKIEGILAAVYQDVFGGEVYPSLEEKAANLLYFMIKDHPFADGCKRIAASLFLEFLNRNNALFREGHKVVSDGALVAITLMIAESDPKEKDIMTTMVMNLLSVG
jgi:prophage maintenance system killer protein